jgi:hypothetical protein
MARIKFTPRPRQMGGGVSEVPAFPGEPFNLGIPEAIGDTARTVWFNNATVEWEELEDGAWKSVGISEGELTYVATITPHEDVIDVHISLTNQSDRDWAQSIAFNCFNAGSAPSIMDRECVRHWVRTGGEFKRLIEVPRQFGPRPTIQLYSVEGAPPGSEIPFVANFRATPDIVLEPWMAIQSRDGKRLVATASKPAMALFQNMEYSCIHCSAGFGPLKPGETGESLNKVYFVEASLEEWHQRMSADLG